MKWFNYSKIRLVLIGFVATIVLVGGIANADFIFCTPTNLAPLTGSGTIWGGCISPDGLSLYFGSTRAGGYGNYDVWVVTRETTENDWSAPVNLGPTVNTPYSEYPTNISADGLSLYIGDHGYNRPGGYGMDDLWVATRETTDAEWGEPVNLGTPVNSAYAEVGGFITNDGLSLYLQSNRPGTLGGHDIWVASRETTDAEWGEPVNLGSTVNSSSSSMDGGYSVDGLALFFDSQRPGGYSGFDIWMATRPTTSDPWNIPVNLGPPINTSTAEFFPNISRDGSTLYFCRPESGVWQVPILPIVDFNSDGIIDGSDICIMVNHWDTYEPLCDIGPMPWGDGIVDVQDLIVLSEHLFEEVNDPTLIAHWPLDEAQGVTAYDKTANYDGILNGDPRWQSDSGIVGGAILLDGIDDYISTDFILNPADSAFSVLAWIKGGAPGQVVLSQAVAANWLCTDSVEGCLMTELKKDSGRFEGDPLSSEVFINDSNWHRIGLVWDGSCRHLYVDGVEVANDDEPLSGLNDAYGGLYIGTGSNCVADTFFSGLIDDVRIYNRVVSP